uniref:Oxidored_FMN domain-containing protein n=1 Tax=Panagrellus redivivus TaxID=6233 RepID=A0A7E4UXJ6_PANRE
MLTKNGPPLQWGLIVTGAITIDSFGINYVPGNMWVGEKEDSPEQRKAFLDLAKAVHRQNGTLIGQVTNFEDQVSYFAADRGDVSHLSRTVYAAKYLVESEFDGIELSVLEAAKTKDGKPDVAKVCELIDFSKSTIRSALKLQKAENLIFGIKVSTARVQHAGYDFTDIIKILQQAEASGYDYVSVAGGSYEFPISAAEDRESLYRQVIRECRKYIGQNIAVYGNGGFRSVPIIDELIESGKLDGIAMTKPACGEFDLPIKLIENGMKAAKPNPFELDDLSSVLAGAAQINQAGSKSLAESNRKINDGVMDLNNAETMKLFLIAKEEFLRRKQKLKDEGRLLPGVITLLV